MTELDLPWLEASILIALLGSIAVSQVRDPYHSRKWALVFSGTAAFCAFEAWFDFGWLHAREASDRWHLLVKLFNIEVFVIDQFSAPLLPLIALLHFLTTVATLKTKIRRFSFAGSLASEAMALATVSTKIPTLIIALLALSTIPPYLELVARKRPTRVYVLHMALFIGCLLLGWSLIDLKQTGPQSLWAIVPLVLAILIRNGIAPFHCWMTDLFENATFGTALLYVTPTIGAYAMVRLLLPVTDSDMLRLIGMLSLATTVYAAGMSIVQRESRRFFCYVFLSHSALVLVGLEIATDIAMTGALCVWLSVGLSLCGFGLTLRALEARRGRLSLTEFQGLYDHTPALAVCFVLTGLASIGFPGTVGYIGTELLVDGAVEAYPYIGAIVLLAAALNGIAMVQAYFKLFTGTRHISSVSLQIGMRERFSVLTLAAIILLGGICPQPFIHSRYHAVEDLMKTRAANNTSRTESP